MTRQQRRKQNRETTWSAWRCQQGRNGRIASGPQDEHGIMPRRVRRRIALRLARKVKK